MTMRIVKTLAFIGFALACASAFAQYANKPIRIISPAPPGGSTDIVSRLVQPGLQDALKQPVIVEARGGAGGYIGSDYVTKQPADGYTLLLGGAFTTITATLQKAPHYSPRRDLSPVAIVAMVPNVMVSGPNLKVSSVAEFIALAKSNPGKLNVGSNGVGTTLHLSGELFKLRTGVDMVHIAYKGWADCVTGLLGGQIDLMFDNISTALPNVASGKTRALAVMATARHRLLPNVPTFDELGIKNAEVTSWFGIMVPAGTPPDIIATLGRIIRTNAETADFQDKVVKLGMDPAAMGPAEAQKFWIGEVDKWETVIKASQIPLQ
ncbi:MAG: Bug family tripartite tricarboxylate transporter substrate binding protein [Burkholderiales bacterium]